jgi:hypothetical protein
MQGNSLYSYLHLKLAKTLCVSFYRLCFFLQQNQRTRGQNRFCPEVGGGVAQIMYTHVNKCKNDKIKFKKVKTESFSLETKEALRL